MDQLWAIAKSLEGRTLRTPARGEPFEVIEVGGTRLKIRAQTGYEHSYSRKVIEAGCHHRLKGGEVRGKGLYEAGIIGNRSPRSYLPAVILAITREYKHNA